MQGTLAGDSGRSQISLSEKVPDYPPCNFTVIGEGVEKEKRGGEGGRGGLGGETEREKKWRMKRGRMETRRQRRDGSRGGDSSSGTDRQTGTSLLVPTSIFLLAFQLQVSWKVSFFIFNSAFQE